MLEPVAFKRSCAVSLPKSPGSLKKVSAAQFQRISTFSLSENSEGSCGEGFWWWPRRRGRRIPAVACNGRANAGHRQKTRRPEGFGTGSQARAYYHQRLAVRRDSCRRNPGIRWFRSRPKTPRQADPHCPGKQIGRRKMEGDPFFAEPNASSGGHPRICPRNSPPPHTRGTKIIETL